MKHETVLTAFEVRDCYSFLDPVTTSEAVTFRSIVRNAEQRILTKMAEKAQPVAFNGWYCAHCQRGVDANEVTYHEQHEVCWRVITNDTPPPAPSALLEAEKTVKELRELLGLQWCSTHGIYPYTDDGQIFDGSESPTIDFMNDSPQEIKRKMTERIKNGLGVATSEYMRIVRENPKAKAAIDRAKEKIGGPLRAAIEAHKKGKV